MAFALVVLSTGMIGCSRERSGPDSSAAGQGTSTVTAPSKSTASGITAPSRPTTTTSILSPSASTTTSTAVTAQAGLPQPVAATREAIVQAALAHDYDRLEQLALQSGSPGSGREGGPPAPLFSFGSGDPSEGVLPGPYWRRQEEKKVLVLEGLVAVLRLPYVSREEFEGGVYVWPDISGIDWRRLTDEQRTRLRRSFSAADIAAWEKAGAYLGYRVGIGPGGRWLFFTEGE